MLSPFIFDILLVIKTIVIILLIPLHIVLMYKFNSIKNSFLIRHRCPNLTLFSNAIIFCNFSNLLYNDLARRFNLYFSCSIPMFFFNLNYFAISDYLIIRCFYAYAIYKIQNYRMSYHCDDSTDSVNRNNNGHQKEKENRKKENKKHIRNYISFINSNESLVNKNNSFINPEFGENNNDFDTDNNEPKFPRIQKNTYIITKNYFLTLVSVFLLFTHILTFLLQLKFDYSDYSFGKGKTCLVALEWKIILARLPFSVPFIILAIMKAMEMEEKHFIKRELKIGIVNISICIGIFIFLGLLYIKYSDESVKEKQTNNDTDMHKGSEMKNRSLTGIREVGRMSTSDHTYIDNRDRSRDGHEIVKENMKKVGNEYVEIKKSEKFYKKKESTFVQMYLIFDTNFIFLITVCLSHAIITLGYPTSFQKELDSEMWGTLDVWDIESMDYYLQKEKNFESLLDFARLFFCVEFLEFWKFVKIYKSGNFESKTSGNFEKEYIFKMFVVPNADRRVEVPNTVRKRVLGKRFKRDPERTVFDEMLKHVLKIIMDSIYNAYMYENEVLSRS